MSGLKSYEMITKHNQMTSDNKVVWVSIGLNVLLAVGLVLFVAFGRTKPIEDYEAEIATLETLNKGLESDIEDLDEDNKASYIRYMILDKEYTLTVRDLEESDEIIKRLTQKRPTNGKSPYVDSLSDDAIIGEFTGYFERRAKRNK